MKSVRMYLSVVFFFAHFVTIDAQRVRYVGSYNSFGNYNMEGKTFYIISGSQNISNNDVEFKQYADQISQIIKWQHAIPTNDIENADICILLDYGVKDESYVANQSVPVWGQTGVSSITTNTNSTGDIYGNAYGQSIDDYSSVTGYINGSSNTTSNTTVSYDYGVTGYRNVSSKVKKYHRVLNLYAYDNKQREGEPVMLWKIIGSSDGSSNDISKVIPQMAKQMRNYIGKSSMGVKKISSYGDELFIDYMKKNLLLSSNVYLNPDYTNGTTKDIAQIYSIMTTENETSLMICIKKSSTVKFMPNTYLVYKGQKFALSNIDKLEIGKTVKVPELHYFVLHFPVKIGKGEFFDYISYTNKKETKVGWCWYNLVF